MNLVYFIGINTQSTQSQLMIKHKLNNEQTMTNQQRTQDFISGGVVIQILCPSSTSYNQHLLNILYLVFGHFFSNFVGGCDLLTSICVRHCNRYVILYYIIHYIMYSIAYLNINIYCNFYFISSTTFFFYNESFTQIVDIDRFP